MTRQNPYYAIEWKSNKLLLLDQRQLPQRMEMLAFESAAGVAQAIRDMVVRGAPAIGISAAYGVVLSALQHSRRGKSWRNAIIADMNVIADARPTAVNLAWAVQRMKAQLDRLSDEQDPVPALLACAEDIHRQDIEANSRMSHYGSALIETPAKFVITHCNTGPLATGGIGTALGVISQAFRDGRISGVYADETRPWLQGARLTSWELLQQNVPVKLICDSAAASIMKQGNISWAIVGADRITANGDVVNKIGTYNLAISARYHGVKFMVVAPSSTIDLQTASGDDVVIENRSPDEVTQLAGNKIAPPAVTAVNPAFDVTPAQLVDAIVTEKGVVRAPNRQKMRQLMDGSSDDTV